MVGYNYDKLLGKIKEVFKTQENFAKALGINRASLNLKLNGKSNFTQNEIEKSVALLCIPQKDISEYFFVKKV